MFLDKLVCSTSFLIKWKNEFIILLHFGHFDSLHDIKINECLEGLHNLSNRTEICFNTMLASHFPILNVLSVLNSYLLYHFSIIMLINILVFLIMIFVLQILMNVWTDFITVLMEQRSVLTLLEILNVNVL